MSWPALSASPDDTPVDGGGARFGSGIAPDAIRQVQRALGAMSADQLERIFARAEELREEDGTYFGPRESTPDWRATGGLDLMPLILAGEEWSQIEAGLSQRVRAWDRFLQDIYSHQEILKAELVPYEVVYADPNFHRGCSRIPGMVESYLQYCAFDLQQDARGQWMVVEDHVGVAEGASYALKKRQVLRQVAPRLFDGLEILPAEDFAAQLLDVMQELAKTPEGVTRSLLLASGSSDDHYLDHAALARQMGVPIVQGSDLVVLDSRLYLKTIGGVERVDVVLRRLTTSLLDPVTFDRDSRHGVPGLLSCVRKGTLAVANGLGSDLANNRTLAAYLPVMIDYYLGERSVIGSPQVLELRDIDVREQVADNRDGYIIRHAWKRGPGHEWIARHMPAHEWNRFWAQEVEAAPADYIATRLPVRATQPCWTASGPRDGVVTLRAFALGRQRVSACALAWTGESSTLSNAIVQGADRLKDVWILRGAPAPLASVHAQAEEAPRRLRLTSRVAESLFWMGRYAERAEVTARMLRIVQGQPWPQATSPTAKQRRPLWAALADVTGHKIDFFLKPGKELSAAGQVPFYFLLDGTHRGSVLSCLRSCRRNAETIREHFPPEVWSVLNRLYLQLAFHADQAGSDPVRQVLEDRSLTQDIIMQLDELTGALEKHMLHDDAWHFWQLGGYAERGINTILTLQQVLAPEGETAPTSTTNLDLLLQMLAGQYAYRSLYHARPVAARVARLLLQDPDFPRSALFCLHGMKRALRATLGENPAKGADTPLKHCERAIGDLDLLEMTRFFPRTTGAAASGDDDLTDVPTPEFGRKLNEMAEVLLEFNVLISDHYLDHQVVFREPELFDLNAAR